MNMVTQNNECCLIWHRRDLRLHDNDIYSTIIEKEDLASVSLFIFDEKYFQPQPSHVNKDFQCLWSGPFYTQAMIEAVTHLRDKIRGLGGELIVRVGDPLKIIPEIAEKINAKEIIFSEEPGSYEQEISQQIKETYIYQTSNSEIHLTTKIGCTLYHPDDLPHDPNEWSRLAHPKNHKKRRKKKLQKLKALQDQYINTIDVSSHRFRGKCRIMGDFRKAARSYTTVLKNIEAPSRLCLPHNFSSLGLDSGSIPTLEQLFHHLKNTRILGLEESFGRKVLQYAIKRRDERLDVDINEENALLQLESFITSGNAAIADRSLADVSEGNSSKLSVHFALGTLSPRKAYWRANEESKEQVKWIMSHLEMRDFFLYTCFEMGTSFFSSKGVPISKKQNAIEWICPSEKMDVWTRYCTGDTKIPMIDAAFKELTTTGYCSNRVRQNMASVLTKDLGIDWRAGALLFQFLLRDHCVACNTGNWLYFSGVGPDPKSRHFRTLSQTKRYDPDGTFIKKWLPEFRNIDDMEIILRPWDHDIDGYRYPIVDPQTQFTWQDLKLLEETGGVMED